MLFDERLNGSGRKSAAATLYSIPFAVRYILYVAWTFGFDKLLDTAARRSYFYIFLSQIQYRKTITFFKKELQFFRDFFVILQILLYICVPILTIQISHNNRLWKV